MSNTQAKQERRQRIKLRMRNKIRGTKERPRLAVYRSNKQIYAQLIDDEEGVTIVSCSSRIKDVSSQPLKKTELSVIVGKKIAELAKEKGIETVVFDRGGYLYHGRVKALADGAREGGLIF